MRIVIVEPNKKPYVAEVEDKLEEYQRIVGGYIEIAGYDNGYVIVCNEEGKLLGLTPNRRYLDDYLAGTFFIVGQNDFDFASLTDAQVEAAMKQFDKVERVTDTNRVYDLVFRVYEP